MLVNETTREQLALSIWLFLYCRFYNAVEIWLRSCNFDFSSCFSESKLHKVIWTYSFSSLLSYWAIFLRLILGMTKNQIPETRRHNPCLKIWDENIILQDIHILLNTHTRTRLSSRLINLKLRNRLKGFLSKYFSLPFGRHYGHVSVWQVFSSVLHCQIFFKTLYPSKKNIFRI